VTIKDGDDEDDNVANTGLSFSRVDAYRALNAIATAANPAYRPDAQARVVGSEAWVGAGEYSG